MYIYMAHFAENSSSKHRVVSEEASSLCGTASAGGRVARRDAGTVAGRLSDDAGGSPRLTGVWRTMTFALCLPYDVLMEKHARGTWWRALTLRGNQEFSEQLTGRVSMQTGSR